MNTTAWLLAVVSSDAQAETLDAQERWGRQAAAENGWTIERVFKDVSSGRDGARQLLKTLLGELRALPKSARPARILLVRIDRLGRGDGLEVIATISEIKKLGVGLFTRDDGDVKLARASDALLPAMKSILAGIENENRADRTRGGIARRKAEGKHHGNAPYGAVLEDGKPVAYEAEAVLVREIFNLRARGWGYDRLAAHAARHARPKLLLGDKTRRLRWGRSTIQRLLWCRTLRGVVVDEEVFDRVQTTKNPDFKSLRKQSWPFPLAHTLRCTCGTLLSGQCSGRENYRTRYYVCRAIARHGFYPHHNADTVEQQFAEQILPRFTALDGLMVEQRIGESLKSLRVRQAAAMKRLETLDRRRRRACELAEDGNMSGPQLQVRLDEIDADRKGYEAELASLQVEIERGSAIQSQPMAVKDALRIIERQWATKPVEIRQWTARVLGGEVGGFWMAPGRRGSGRRRIESEIKMGWEAPNIIDAEARHLLENMREVDTLRNVDMAQRKMDDTITKKFIQTITE
ncbi:MAG TPA: recombinase family protein [Candidatus Cybelea sp.]